MCLKPHITVRQNFLFTFMQKENVYDFHTFPKQVVMLVHLPMEENL
jgi:hypothetical protein